MFTNPKNNRNNKNKHIRDIHEKQIFSSDCIKKLGELHWYLLRAKQIVHAKSFEKPELEKKLFQKIPKITIFEQLIGGDEIHWWIFYQEKDVTELKEKTNTVLEKVQVLKENVEELRQVKFDITTYDELLAKLREFVEKHEGVIDELHDYIKWLHSKDEKAPAILFSHRVWGHTELHDRGLNTIDLLKSERPTDEIVKTLAEIVLGLREAFLYTLQSALIDIANDIAESMYEPKEYVPVPKVRVFQQTADESIEMFRTYIVKIRDSLRNIISECEKYESLNARLYDERFWVDFIKCVIDKPVETELWDFKKTLSMWHVSGSEKRKEEIKFCEIVAGFANAKGGVIIVGITDERPRDVVGLKLKNDRDLENKIKNLKEVIRKWIKYDKDFVHIQPVNVPTDAGDKICLVIAIAQTSDVVATLDDNGRYSFPLRVGTGLARVSLEEINAQKEGIIKDNFNFLVELEQIIQQVS